MWAAVLLAAAMVTAAHGGESSGPPASPAMEIVIDIRSGHGDPAYWKSRAADLIGLKPGKTFTPAGLRTAVDILKASRLFEDITVAETLAGSGGPGVRLLLKPFRRIKDIRVIDAFPVLEREVLNAMTIYTGDVFAADKLPEQEGLLIELYQREGYIEPGAALSARTDPRDGDVTVTVTIRKGDYCILRNVEIAGNRAYSDIRLGLPLNTWKTSYLFGDMRRFNRKDMEDDAKSLLKFYRQHRYADALVNAVVLETDGPSGKAIRFEIEEGPRYDIEFAGNHEFWDWTLAKELVLFQQGNRGGRGLKKSLENIRRRYHRAGYLQVKVEAETGEETENGVSSRRIKVRIEEGPRSVVETIVIRGNRSLAEDQIRQQMLTRTPGLIHDGPFVPETLEADIRAIVLLYLKNGYRKVAVHPEITFREEESGEIRRACVGLDITAGAQTRIDRIELEGVGAGEREELIGKLALKTGEPFREYMLESDENTLAAVISEQGHPHVETAGRVEFGADGGAAVFFTVDKGPYAEMGRVYYLGNFRTRERIIRDELEQRPGEPFSFQKMLLSQRNIQDIGAFTKARIRPRGLKEKAETIDLMVEVEEKKPYFFQFGGGYNTQKRFYANSRVGDHNLLGLNKDAFVGGELSMIGYRAEAGVVEPRFLWSRVRASLNLYGEERREFNKSFGTRTKGASLLLDRDLLETVTAGLGLSYEMRDQFQRTAEPIPEEDLAAFETRNVLMASPNITYDSSDFFLRPRKGMIAGASMDISRGLVNSLDDFNKYGFRLHYYYTPVTSLTLALRGRVGHIDPLNARSAIPEDQLFYLGGVADVRGFEENKLRYDASGQAVGGRSELLASAEARWDLGLNVELSVFYDAGRIQEALTGEGDDDWHSSVGLGLAYITPIGPMGLMYGHKINRRPDESPGAVHFSIGYTF
ncbi:MAG: BamA/TamA family outer membrane protein [Thermodesulfobacteriota bacterium]